MATYRGASTDGGIFEVCWNNRGDKVAASSSDGTVSFYDTFVHPSTLSLGNCSGREMRSEQMSARKCSCRRRDLNKNALVIQLACLVHSPSLLYAYVSRTASTVTIC